MNPNTLAPTGISHSPALWEQVTTDTVEKVNTHVLRPLRVEQMIYSDLREQVKAGLDELEADGAAQVDTFPSLIQDIFISLYSIKPRHNDPDALTLTARQFNASIMDNIMNSEQYHAVKALCEGHDLVAYGSVHEIAQFIHESLDELLDSDSIEELEALESQQAGLRAKVQEALANNALANTQDIAESLAANEQQIDKLSKLVVRGVRQSSSVIQDAVAAALDKAQETSAILQSWGDGYSSPQAIQQNMEILRRVQSSKKLRNIIKYLGKFREIYDNARKSSYTHGRGEKYDIVLGKDFTRAIASEYALLALPETVPLFIQKVQRKALKQYRRRERVNKGYGDIVVCIDESGSMTGDPIAWAKAVAIVLLEHAVIYNRRCAMVRFASDDKPVTHIFSKGKYTTEDVFNFAESFLNGGTDFETPLSQAATLIENEGFENADIMFITDGACCISDNFVSSFRDKCKQLKFSVTGIIIDTDGASTDSSLTPFCKKVYHLSGMSGDDIVLDIITSFVQ